jgi:hypothetical protein
MEYADLSARVLHFHSGRMRAHDIAKILAKPLFLFVLRLFP